MPRVRPAPTCSSPSAAARSPTRPRWSRFCLGNGVTDPAQLDGYRARIDADGTIVRPQVEAACGAHDRDPDDLVGRRVHRLGRLHRHGAQRQGELQP